MTNPEPNQPGLELEPTEPVVAPEPNEPPELSPTEVAAQQQGWMPKEDWVASGKDPDEWRSAREFVDRGELLNQLHNVKRQLRQTSEATEVLKAHHQRVYESAYQNAVRALRKERRDALRDEDFDRADQIEERIDELKEQRAVEKQAPVAQNNASQNEVFNAWRAKNQWYDQDAELKEAADAFGVVFASKNQGATPDEVFNHVEKKIKSTFPHKFGGRQGAPSPVAGVSQRSRPAGNKSKAISLTEDEEKAMATLVKRGHMTEEEYMNDIRKLRGE